MDFLRWVIGGSIGGAIGAAIWAAVAYFTNVEVGWIAWGIGVAAGIGVRSAAGSTEGWFPGVVAVVIAAFSILAGKYAAVSLSLADMALGENIAITPDGMVMGLALEILAEQTKQGKTIAWPKGVTEEAVEKPSDFPPDIWQEATKRWESLGSAEQQRQIDERAAYVKEMAELFQGKIRKQAFLASFGGFDILWFLLAAGSAFKIGSGAAAGTESS